MENVFNVEVTLQVRQKSARILSGLAHSYFLSEPDQLRLIQVFRSRIRRKMKKSLKSKSPAKRRFVHEDIAGDKEKLLVCIVCRKLVFSLLDLIEKRTFVYKQKM